MASNIGFIGTKSFLTMEQEISIIRLLGQYSMESSIHHGDEVGSCETFHKIVVKRGFSVVVHPSTRGVRGHCDRNGVDDDVVTWEVKTSFKRYCDVVNECNTLFFCPKGLQKKRWGGGWFWVGYARRMEKTIAILWPDGMITVEE